MDNQQPTPVDPMDELDRQMNDTYRAWDEAAAMGILAPRPTMTSEPTVPLREQIARASYEFDPVVVGVDVCRPWDDVHQWFRTHEIDRADRILAALDESGWAVVPVGADNAPAEVVSELVALRSWINENDTRYHDTFNFGSDIVERLDDMIAAHNVRVS